MAAINATIPEDLPLVLLTFGNEQGEFEAMYDHLEAVRQEANPRFQSLIVARPEVPGVLLKMLAARVRSLPTVYLRNLGESTGSCSELHHETGKFFVSKTDRKKGA